MARVLCKLANASTLINGVRFASVPGGMLSEAISDEAAAGFTSIPGYFLASRKGEPLDGAKPEPEQVPLEASAETA